MRKRPRNPCKPYRSNVAYIHVPTSKYFVCPPTMWSSSFNPINVFQILISPTRVNMTRHHIFNFRSAGSTVPFLVTVGSLEHPSLPGYRDESLCAMCDFIFHRRLLAIKKKKKRRFNRIHRIAPFLARYTTLVPVCYLFRQSAVGRSYSDRILRHSPRHVPEGNLVHTIAGTVYLSRNTDTRCVAAENAKRNNKTFIWYISIWSTDSECVVVWWHGVNKQHSAVFRGVAGTTTYSTTATAWYGKLYCTRGPGFCTKLRTANTLWAQPSGIFRVGEFLQWLQGVQRTYTYAQNIYVQ